MIVACASAAGPLRFAAPREVVTAERIADVRDAFARLDVAVAAGAYVAGFVTYDAGAAFVAQPGAVMEHASLAPPVRDPTHHKRDATRCEPRLPLVAFGIYDAPVAQAPSPTVAAYEIGPLAPRVARSAYDAAFGEIARAIYEGDAYQVNYGVPFDFAFAGEPCALAAALRERDAAPYAAYVETDAYALVSQSPELFVRRERDRIVTKPMKGTSAPGASAHLRSAKNRAEHVMIVDLLRNDLHRLGGDVSVERLLEIERYATFDTLTTTLITPLGPERTWTEIFAAMFPCGSITGAPKAAAMRAIARAEREPRGIFCGSIGYAAPDGTGVWNVAIRTAAIDRRAGRGTLRIGGGIVADSTAAGERDELAVKRRFFEALAPRYALLETLRRDPGGAYVRLDAHLARLARSADALHVDCDEAAVRAALAAFDRDARGASQLVRIRLERDGAFELEARDLEDPSQRTSGAVGRADRRDTLPRVCIATTRMPPDDALRGHKTTWRPHYDAAAAEALARGCFDALVLTTGGDVADGSRTNVFVRDASGIWTPPLATGALPGVLRDALVRSGFARERRVTETELIGARAVYVGNSARGLRRATIV